MIKNATVLMPVGLFVISLGSLAQKPSVADLSSELRRRSTSEGLRISRSGMSPIWFDGLSHAEAASSCERCEPNAGSNYIRPSPLDPYSIVFRCDQTELAVIPHWLITEAEFERGNNTFAFVGRSLKANAAGDYRQIPAPEGLFIGHLHPMLEIIRRIDTPTEPKSQAKESSISWAPSGRRFAYCKYGRIYIYDCDSGKTLELIRGQFPNWSPDGRWISAVSDNGAFLIDPDTREMREILVNHVILGALRWSPDSSYLLFAEPRWYGFLEALNAVDPNRMNLGVFRMSDHAIVTVAVLPRMDTSSFYWYPCHS